MGRPDRRAGRSATEIDVAGRPANDDRPAGPDPGPADADALASVVDQLRSERDGLRTAMRSRALIEQAKGILMSRHRIDAAAAFEWLRTTSQRTNVRLAEVAAAVVAEVSPPPPAGAAEPRPGPVRAVPVGSPADPGPVAADPGTADAPHVEYLITRARVDAARSLDEVIAAVAATSTGWPAPDAVVLTVTEPDGALRIVAYHGLAPEIASQWTRIPPQVNVPLTAAARRQSPVWLPDRERLMAAFPMVAQLSTLVSANVSIPMTHGDRVIGVFGLAWYQPVRWDMARRGALLGVADAVAAAVLRTAGEVAPRVPFPEVADQRAVGSPDWLRPLLDGLLVPAALLTPVRDGDDVVDFRFEWVNEPGRADAAGRGVRLTGSTVLTVTPELGTRILVPVYRAVLLDGHSRQCDDLYRPASPSGGPGVRQTVRAVRLGGRVLVTWRTHHAVELIADDLLATGRALRAATFRWRPATGELLHTPELSALLGLPAGRPLTVAAVAGAIDRAVWNPLRLAVLGALRHGRPLVTTLRAGQGCPWLRLVGERVSEPTGGLAFRGHLQLVVGPPPAQPGRPRQSTAVSPARVSSRSAGPATGAR